MQNFSDMDEPIGAGVVCYPCVTVTIITEHPNERELTHEARPYAHDWLKRRIGAQLCIALPEAAVIVRFAEFDVVRVTGAQDKEARMVSAYTASVLYDSLMDWAREVERTGGTLPSGNPMFADEQ